MHAPKGGILQPGIVSRGGGGRRHRVLLCCRRRRRPTYCSPAAFPSPAARAFITTTTLCSTNYTVVAENCYTGDGVVKHRRLPRYLFPSLRPRGKYQNDDDGDGSLVSCFSSSAVIVIVIIVVGVEIAPGIVVESRQIDLGSPFRLTLNGGAKKMLRVVGSVPPKQVVWYLCPVFLWISALMVRVALVRIRCCS